MRLDRLKLQLQTAVDMAFHARQEILEAALAERNQNTALELARFEYIPDYQVGYSYRSISAKRCSAAGQCYAREHAFDRF